MERGLLDCRFGAQEMMELPRMAKESTEPLLRVQKQLHPNQMPVSVHGSEVKVPWDFCKHIPQEERQKVNRKGISRNTKSISHNTKEITSTWSGK